MVNNSYNVTLMDPSTLAKAQEALPQCTRLIDDCQRNTTTCLEAAIFCEANVEAAFTASGRNAFDIRQLCTETDAMNCYDASAVTRYLNSDATRAYLNVSDGPQRKTWSSCSTAVAMGFAFDVMKRFDRYVADLLDHASVRVLIYHGDADLVCNWHGGLAWTRELEWSHRAEFNSAQERPFLVDGGGHYHSSTQAGVIRAYKDRLTFLRVFNAGHFMPMNQPAAALEMVIRFLKGVEL
jgi:carboxypeptidase C (cathepsin A)